MGGVAKAVLKPFGLYQEPPPLIPAPEVKAPPVMPTPDDQAVKDAKRRSLAGRYARRGRQSTIMSDSVSETLG